MPSIKRTAEDKKRHGSFGDSIEIEVSVPEFKGARLTIGYVMKNTATGDVVLTGKTKHCFVNGQGRPILLRKAFAELDEIFKNMAGQGADL